MSLVIPMYTAETEFILISIPVTIILAYIPWLIKLIGYCGLKSRYDNANPRLYVSSLENEALIGNKAAQFVLRAHACNLNSIEDLACYSAAPIVGLLTSEVPKLTLSFCAIHLCLRFLYMLLYVFNGSRPLSFLRSLVFWLGWCSPLVILFECAHAVGDRL